MSDIAAATASTTQAAAPARSWFWKDASGFSFHDLIDAINPLQHLPVIGTVYRWLTGDEPGNIARVVGDGLYGGPIGAGVSLFNVVTQDKQGHDLGEQVLTAVFGPGHDRDDTAVAATKPADPPMVTEMIRNADAAVDLSAGSAWSKPAPRMLASAAPTPVSPASATTPAPSVQASTAAPPADPPAKLDHAPMPLATGQPKGLYGGIATPPPSNSAAPSGPQGDPVKAFLARNSGLQRDPGGPKYSVQATAPVPLVMPPGSLPQHPSAPAAAPTAPVDVSQKMLDALDKYMKLQQKREGVPAETPAPAAVDLTL